MLVQDAITHRAVTISPHQRLPDAAILMDTLRIQQLPVVHEGKLVAIITDGMVRRALPPLHAGLTPWEAAVRAAGVHVGEVALRPALSTTVGTPLSYAIRTMLDRHVGALPVVRADNSVEGILTLTDVLRWAAEHPQKDLGAVREAMSPEAVSIDVGAPAADAAARLRVGRLRVLPVTEGERGHLAGVVHDDDVRHRVERAAVAHGDTVLADQFLLQGVGVRDLMRAPGATVLASVPLQDAVEKMVKYDVHGLPVLSDGGRLLGVITVSDVLRALVRIGEAARA